MKVLAVVIALIIPISFAHNNFYTFLLSLIAVNAILALSYNLTSGQLGLDNFAIGGLAGLGGYVNAYLLIRADMPFPVAVLAGGLMSAIIGTILVYPSLRIRGFYFAVVTIIVQLLLSSVFTNWTAFTRGDTGITGVPSPDVPAIGFAYVLLSILILFALLISKLTSATRGLKLAAIRDDEVLAADLGIDVTRQKVILFAIASFMTGISGALLASLNTIVTPNIGNIFTSFNIFTMVYLGGRGGILGPIIGSFILTALPNAVLSIYPYREYINGALLMIVAMFLPYGIVGAFKQIYKIFI